MNKHIALAIAALGVSVGAQAAITVSNGSLGPTFLDLTAPGVVSGGTLYTTSSGNSTAAIPFNASGPTINTVFAKGWLAAGPSHAANATLNLPAGTTAVSFLWGSPDGSPSNIINTLTINTLGGGGPFSFTVGPPVNIPQTQGVQSEAYYRTFSTDIGTITSLQFDSTINAFEISNVTAVPEPEAYGLALAGMGVVAFAMRRRRQS